MKNLRKKMDSLADIKEVVKMPRFTTKELHGLGKLAATPEKLPSELTRLVLSSKKIVPKVELSNEKTGEYRVRLEGTLETAEE